MEADRKLAQTLLDRVMQLVNTKNGVIDDEAMLLMDRYCDLNLRNEKRMLELDNEMIDELSRPGFQSEMDSEIRTILESKLGDLLCIEKNRRLNSVEMANKKSIEDFLRNLASEVTDED